MVYRLTYRAALLSAALIVTPAVAPTALAPSALAQSPPVQAGPAQSSLAQAGPVQAGDDEPKETEEQREARAIREAQKRLHKQEEMFLRIQLEQQLNKIASWDPDAGEIRLSQKDLSGVEIPLELLLEEICEPAGRGDRIRFKDDVKVRPFATAVQGYMARGGMDDVERLQKGQQPFEDGIPERVTDLIAELLDALNQQQDVGDAVEQAELAKEAERRELQDRLADRMGFDKEQTERYGKILRRLARRLERSSDGKGAVERVRDFALSPRAQRLADQIAESEAVKGTQKVIEDNVEQFLQSEQAAEIQRQIESYLDSDDGRAVREQLEQLLGPGGGSLRDRLERLRGSRSDPKREKANPKRERAEPKRDKVEPAPKGENPQGEPSLY